MTHIGPGARFTLHEELGAGQVTRVLRATDTLLQGERAIKLLRPEVVDALEARARILTEARSLSKITHPNVVRMYDLVHSELGPALILELATGPVLDLTRHLERKSLLEVVHLGLGLLDGLEALHTQGIVHRNIEPRNLLLSQRRTVLLSDLFDARLESERRLFRTRPGDPLGSILFAAPEQRGDPARATARSDLFSVGATLYMLASGRPPPDLSMLDFDAAPLDRIPKPLWSVVRRATLRNPDQRYGSVDAMRSELVQLS